MAEECLGLVLGDLNDFEVFWILFGDGSNGKNVFQDLLKMLVGPHNVSSVELETLSERFQAWPLAENRLNINDEVPATIGKSRLAKVEDKLKSFVSGGDIEVEFNGRDKYVMPCTARFLFSTNTLPPFRDRSNGLWRRMQIIDFSVSIPKSERIPKLAERHLCSELPAIFMRAVAALGRILEYREVFEGAKSKLMKDEHRGLCDPEKIFFTTCYEPGEESYFIPTQYIYDAYKAWCCQNGRQYVSQQKLIARIPTIFPNALVNQQKKFHGNRKRGVLGVREQPTFSDEITPAGIGYGTLLSDGRSPEGSEKSSLRLVESKVKEVYTKACA
jgi:P4 family phage/plasmid primase-like protien